MFVILHKKVNEMSKTKTYFIRLTQQQFLWEKMKKTIDCIKQIII